MIDIYVKLNAQIDRLLYSLERMQLEEYLKYVEDKRRLFWVNFWSGVARGLGTAVGFTVLGAVVIVILQNVVVDNIPLIGDFLAEVMRIVQERL